MKRNVLLSLLPLAWLAGCDYATAPLMPLDETVAAAAVVSAGHAELIPYSAHENFGKAPDAVKLVCAPADYGIGAPNRFVGEGVATHLGKTKTVITFDACTVNLTGGRAWISVGHAVQTAANGDELWVDFTMTQYLNGDFTIDEMTTTGGTGRFANVTGSLTGSGWLNRDLDTLPGYYDLVGVISTAQGNGP
jgi:hypothetical protein